MAIDPLLAAEAVEHPGRVSRRARFPGVATHLDDAAFWRSRTGRERLAAMEALRRLVYGEGACTARLQRVLAVVDFSDLDG